MTVRKWAIWHVPLRQAPMGTRLLTIPFGSIVDFTGNQQPATISGRTTLWSEVVYKGTRAWVHDGYLEDLVEKFPDFEVTIENPTPEPNDPAQYVILDAKIKHNLCGELCVAFLGGDSLGIFLDKWKVVSPKFYQWAVQGDNDKATDINALESMLGIYGYPFPSLRFEQGLTDPVIGFKLSPGRLTRVLETHFLIAGVKIDSISGRLRGQGASHWVVVDKLIPDGVNAGRVELYNPFPNKRQEYSYDELINSIGADRKGIWVERRNTT